MKQANQDDLLGENPGIAVLAAVVLNAQKFESLTQSYLHHSVS